MDVLDSSFENLKVWQKSNDFVIDVYKVLTQFPEYEKYAITAQIRRAVNSICANIAEGTGRRTKKDYLNFLYIARGSLEEVKSFLIVSKKLGYIREEQLMELKEKADTIGKMLNGLIRSLFKEKEQC